MFWRFEQSYNTIDIGRNSIIKSTAYKRQGKQGLVLGILYVGVIFVGVSGRVNAVKDFLKR